MLSRLRRNRSEAPWGSFQAHRPSGKRLPGVELPETGGSSGVGGVMEDRSWVRQSLPIQGVSRSRARFGMCVSCPRETLIFLPRLLCPRQIFKNTGKNPGSRGFTEYRRSAQRDSSCGLHQSPREDFLQRRQNGPNPQSSWFRRSGVRPNVKAGLRCCCRWGSQDPTLRNALPRLALSSMALLSCHPSPPEPFSHRLTPSRPLPSSSGLLPPLFLHQSRPQQPPPPDFLPEPWGT